MSLPRALVLTAGLGTRLRPLTYVRAKAAVPVNGETLARRVVRWLAAQGVHDLVLNLPFFSFWLVDKFFGFIDALNSRQQFANGLNFIQSIW